MRHYVLDAFAVMAFLNDEPGKERVKELLEKALQNDIKLYMHAVNLIEIYYTVYREDGTAKADAVYSTLKALPIILVTLNRYRMVGTRINGRVTYISPAAQFTPKNIQTKEERVKLVYGVKIELDNPEKLLKPGCQRRPF